MPTITRKQRTAFFHGSGTLWESGQRGRLDCINLLTSTLIDNDFEIKWLRMSEGVEEVARKNSHHLHVILGDVPLTGNNILYCIPSYLHGFWYFDLIGTRNNSSMLKRQFCPEKMSSRYAREFSNKLRSKFVDANLSKFDQDVFEDFKPQKNSICIFAQNFDEPKYHKHYLKYPELIESVISNRGNRQVYIKPHPQQMFEELETLSTYHDPGNGIEVTNQSIHRLLANASVAVSLSSAVLLEAQMHRVPSVVAGQVDFHHNMVTVREQIDVEKALKTALNEKFEYEKFLVFFFAHGMIQPRMKKMALERIENTLKLAGFLE